MTKCPCYALPFTHFVLALSVCEWMRVWLCIQDLARKERRLEADRHIYEVLCVCERSTCGNVSQTHRQADRQTDISRCPCTFTHDTFPGDSRVVHLQKMKECDKLEDQKVLLIRKQTWAEIREKHEAVAQKQALVAQRTQQLQQTEDKLEKYKVGGMRAFSTDTHTHRHTHRHRHTDTDTHTHTHRHRHRHRHTPCLVSLHCRHARAVARRSWPK